MLDPRRPRLPGAVFLSDIPPPAAASFTPPPVAGVPVGTIIWCLGLGSFSIVEWLPLDGRDWPTADYPLLATVVGTTYEPAFGAPAPGHFRLPNLRGRMTIAADAVDFFTGGVGGEKNHVLTANEMPSHTHAMNPGGFGPLGIIGPGVSGFGGGGSQFTAVNTTGATGGGVSHNNMPPYVVVPEPRVRALP